MACPPKKVECTPTEEPVTSIIEGVEKGLEKLFQQLESMGHEKAARFVEGYIHDEYVLSVLASSNNASAQVREAARKKLEDMGGGHLLEE